MEEPDDSLNSDPSEGVSAPVLTFDRRIEMEATNRLINSLSNNREVENSFNSMDQHNILENDSAPLDQRYLMNMQADNFTNAQQTDLGDDFHRPGEGFNVDDEMMIREVTNYQIDQLHLDTDTSALHSGNTYKRSGPEGSPAFQQASSGFLPMDNESVVFRPVKTLDFSALDETAATEEVLSHGMNRSVSTPESKKRHVPFIQEREICGSLGDDEQSRDTSPSNEFFELKKSPTQSTECEEELNSQVIFSPLKDFEHFQNDSLETGRFSKSPASDTSPRLHTSGSSSISPSQRINYIPFSSYHTNEKLSNMQNTGSPMRISGSSGFLPSDIHISPHHQNLHSETETGRCTPPQSPAHSLSPSSRQGHQHLIKSSPGRYNGTSPGKYGVNFEKKEVLVSIPQMSQDVFKEKPSSSETFKRPEMIGYSQNLSNDSGITEQTGTHSGVRYSQMSDSDRDEFMSSDRAGQEQSTSLPSGSAWEIPNTEESRSQPKNLSRDQRMKSKQLGERRPFVSAVRNAPKPVHVHMNKHQRTTKGDNFVSRDNQLVQNQRNKVPGAENRQVNGPYRNSKMEGQVSQRGEGQGSQKVGHRTNTDERDKRVLPGHTRQTNSITSKREKQNGDVRNVLQSKNSPRNHGYLQGDRMLNQREETQGEASEGQRSLHLGENTSPKHPGLNVITQVQQYGPLDMDDYLHTHNEFDMKRPDRSLDVQGMEDVRSQLQSMLKMSFDADKNLYNTHTDQILDLDNLPQNPQNLHLNPVTDYSAFSARSQDDVSDLIENFPSFTSRMWTESANVSRSEGSLNSENQRLREAVEKERYRRKHCEQHIQRLNVKLLETQQQLAVAVSTDKRKDIMIEQLDKMLEHFEKDMADTVESLRKEKQKSELTIDKLQTEIMEKEREKAHAQELLEAEKERTKLMSQEWDNIHENREHLEKKLQQLQDRLHSEQDDWFKREQELIQKIDEVNENNQKILQQERESLKVEMGIMEAKFESNHRMLEADLHSQMEKEIAAQIADVHKRMEQTEDELRENHRHQITEINQRNKRDLEKQLAKFHEELRAKDEENRKQCQEYEERLQTIRKEVSNLKSAKQKLESQRYEILTKFQYMMQSQWNEAVSLLVSTPQRQNMKSFTPGDGNTENKGGVSFRIPNQSNGSYQTSSPGRERIQSTEQSNTEQGQAELSRGITTSSLELNNPQSDEINLNDFNASLHMQQFLQSITLPPEPTNHSMLNWSHDQTERSLLNHLGYNLPIQEAQVSQRLVYSPPTKQTRSQTSEEHSRQQDDSTDDSVGEISAVLEETMKLNVEYNQIEEKFDKHEYRQSELQHYIQMLLQKPPGGVVGDSVNDVQIDENASMFSHDQTEDLDLNDTAQAAQMQKEFQRIQQLREKQALTVKKPENNVGQQSGSQDPTATVTNPMMPGVLPPEQLADISRLLGQYREHWEGNPQHEQKDGEQIVELVAMLKNMQKSQSEAAAAGQQQHTPKGKRAPVSRISPGSPKNKEIAKVKRNLKGQLSMMPDGSQQKEVGGDRGPSAKVQGQPQPKKVERKVAAQGNAVKGQNKTKSAWK
ncbi:hypothetical protein KUTeg_012512 [Tegillarca granosa]|uniref:Centrobin n=1 Tax=Tegillarca granosa TaxID=220873 RepID=A0ABQ9F429_TEGGR|nr:hypothetical protein KUTeg_012512 [Tegillarca granosa]